jgi:serine/threonine protein kinase
MMARARKQRDELGSLTSIGQGGQGVIYRAPNVRTSFTDALVYKEYKPEILATVDFKALAAMPALVETSMSRRDGERLISLAAWPCEIVEVDGEPTGFLMPEIPANFNIPLETLKGKSDSLAEFQHLLNPKSVLEARGIAISEMQRYKLLREVASGIVFLHDNGVCIGDLSPKNLLFSLEPRKSAYFVDCDAMRIHGMSVLPQVETPGWEVPPGEEWATVYSDSYKLGLLALRLLAGSQIATNIDELPSGAPVTVRQIISDALGQAPEKRPLPTTWTYILGNAIEEIQHRKKSAPKTAPATARATAGDPETPSMVTAGPSPARPVSNPDSESGIAVKTAFLFVAVAAAIAVTVGAVALSLASGGSNSASSNSSSNRPTHAYSKTGDSNDSNFALNPTFYPSPTPSRVEPTYAAPTPPRQGARPPLVQGADANGVNCGGGFHLNSRTGWGTQSGRGTEATSCRFAQNVLESYWSKGEAISGLRTLSTPGSVPCNSVSGARCEGTNFIMECREENSDGWITCRGGRDAIVYLY